MSINDIDFISINIEYINHDNMCRLIRLFHSELDQFDARVEIANIGTYIYLDKLSKDLLFKIRKFIESNIK